MSALRAGDLDLTLAFWDADRHAALLAAEKFVRVPLFPALFDLPKEAFDLIDLFEEPEPFLRAFHMIPGERPEERITQSDQADGIKEILLRDDGYDPQDQKQNEQTVIQFIIAVPSLHKSRKFIFQVVKKVSHQIISIVLVISIRCPRCPHRYVFSSADLCGLLTDYCSKQLS